MQERVSAEALLEEARDALSEHERHLEREKRDLEILLELKQGQVRTRKLREIQQKRKK